MRVHKGLRRFSRCSEILTVPGGQEAAMNDLPVTDNKLACTIVGGSL